jgi:hypothetical protein
MLLAMAVRAKHNALSDFRNKTFSTYLNATHSNSKALLAWVPVMIIETFGVIHSAF